MRKCCEVLIIGDGTGVTAHSSGNPVRPDVPTGLSWSVVGGDPSRIVVDDPLDTPIPKATWSGTESEAIKRWGKSADDIGKLIK